MHLGVVKMYDIPWGCSIILDKSSGSGVCGSIDDPSLQCPESISSAYNCTYMYLPCTVVLWRIYSTSDVYCMDLCNGFAMMWPSIPLPVCMEAGLTLRLTEMLEIRKGSCVWWSLSTTGACFDHLWSMNLRKCCATGRPTCTQQTWCVPGMLRPFLANAKILGASVEPGINSNR